MQPPGAGAGAGGELYYSSPVNGWHDLRRAFGGWARQLREALDEAHQLKAVEVIWHGRSALWRETTQTPFKLGRQVADR